MMTLNNPARAAGAAPAAANADAHSEGRADAELRLEFAQPSPLAFVGLIAAQVARGARRVRLLPDNPLARQLALLLRARFADLHIDTGADAAPGSAAGAEPADDTLTVLCETDPQQLSALLLQHLDSRCARLLAPITAHHHLARPLFLISIPKSGTHLLYALARMLGYEHGMACPITPKPGTTYFIQSEHSHTRAKDFLGESPWHAPFANRHHPFMQAPALFIYRNPLDILLSEAHWYPQDGMNVFAGYYSGLSLEERVLRLIDDPWLLGSIRDRVGAFAAWLDLPNVVPIAFEEIVGARGGGSDEAQRRLLWSLQLKLHVPGTPDEFAAKVFDPQSPTFRTGQSNAYRQQLSPAARAKFLTLPQDFMAAYGYDSPDAEAPAALPCHLERFRHRPLRVSPISYRDSPVMLEHGFLEHNLVLFRGRVFGLPWSLGPFDLLQATPQQLSRLLQAKDLNEIKNLVLSTVRRTLG